MKYRAAHIESLKGLTRDCRDCGTEMTATGDLEYDEDLHKWFVLFFCPSHDWLAPTVAADLEPLIQKLTADIDPSTLPYAEY